MDKVQFEEFELAGDYLDGEFDVISTADDWDLGKVRVYAGRDGFALVEVGPDLATTIREHFMARPSWVAWVDEIHAAHFPPAPRRRPHLVSLG